MQVDQVIQKFHGKREVNPTKFDLSLYHNSTDNPKIQTIVNQSKDLYTNP